MDLGDIAALLKTAAPACYIIVGLCFSMLLLVMTPYPFNYAAFLMPWTPAMAYGIKEQNRQGRISLMRRANPDAFEGTEQQRKEALEYVERQRKKTKRF